MQRKQTLTQEALAAFGQAHLWDFAEGLPANKKQPFLESLTNLPFPAVAALFQNAQTASSRKTGALAPADFTEKKSLPKETLCRYEKTGKGLIMEGAAAAVTMAGGQGTRLGFDGPKGCFDIGIGKSLFAVQAERLLALGREAARPIPWYIMTSEENHSETVAFFRQNSFFSLAKEDVFFFPQGMLPLLLADGRMFINETGQVAAGPDGNGGVFKALAASGALADMQRRGCKWVFFCGIDNALVRMADPLLLGFAQEKNVLGASKSVAKTDPFERVGVFAAQNGRPGVVEYSELPEDLAKQRDSKGRLLFGDANIIAHLLAMPVLEEIARKGLPYHTAYKKEPVLFPGEPNLQPETPNALKFETFIFDAFVFLNEMPVLRCERNEEFAPVKNSTGADSPATALALFRKLFGNA